MYRGGALKDTFRVKIIISMKLLTWSKTLLPFECTFNNFLYFVHCFGPIIKWNEPKMKGATIANKNFACILLILMTIQHHNNDHNHVHNYLFTCSINFFTSFQFALASNSRNLIWFRLEFTKWLHLALNSKTKKMKK